MTQQDMGFVLVAFAVVGAIAITLVCVFALVKYSDVLPPLPAWPDPPSVTKSPKDCPVCDGEATVRPVGPADDGIYWVECVNGEGCCLQGPTAPTRAKAIALWDRLELASACNVEEYS